MPTPQQSTAANDPWAQAAAEYKPQQGTSQTAGTSKPADDDAQKLWTASGDGDDPNSFANSLRKNLERNTTDPAPTGGFLHDNVMTPLLHVANRAGRNFGGLAIDALPDNRSVADQLAEQDARSKSDWDHNLFNPESKSTTPVKDAVEAVANATPLLPGIGSQGRQYASSSTPFTDAAGDALTAGIVGGTVHGMQRIPGAMKDFVRGDVDAPVAGSSVTPRFRYDAAKRLGVNLDAADATGSPLLGNLKRIGENSLAGGHLYDNLKAENTGALQNSTGTFLDKMYEGDRESGGKEIYDALQRDHEGLRQGAETGFTQLTDQTKGKPVKGAPAVGDSATALLRQIEPLAEQYPSLAPKKTLSVLGDLSRIGKTPPTQPTGFLDAPGSEFAVTHDPGEAQPTTWSDLQRLRSATHDLTTTNPDLVKSQAIAPLQRMTHSIDDAMTNGSSGLTPAQAEIFRSANEQWKDMKGTYDDPSSPFYHAVRTDNPSTLFGGVGPKTPENAINLRKRLSPFENYPDEPSDALGALRRGTVEGALKPNNEGAPNFRNFGTQLNRIPADYRAELFSPDQNDTLRDVNHTSNVLAKDFNPSGSGKLAQKVAEFAAMVPTAGLPLVQYPIAKLMTHPGAVDWLMKPSRRINPFVAPAAGAATVVASQKRTSPFQ